MVAGREIAPQHMDHMRKQYQKLMQIRAKGLMSMRDIQFDEENQELFIVMELLPGKNLRQTTKHMAGKSPEERLKLLSDELHQISSILDMLFNNTGFVDGDLKPESIFYTDQDRELYLLDYGVTNFLSHQQRKLTPEDTLVVPNYAAPEYWEQKALDNRRQQYSLACVIYELLTDQLVFDYNSDLLLKETEMSIEDDERLKRYSQMVKTSAPQIVQIPEHIQVILLKALSKSPSDRYENCSSFIKNLIPKQEFRDSKKSPALAMVMGIAIIALAIGGIMMMNKESGKESQQAQLAVSTQTTEPKGTAPSATAPTLEGPPPPEEVVQSMKSPTTEVKEGKSWEEQNAAAQLQEKLENQATIKITQVEARWAELEPNAQKYSIDTRFFTETLNKMKDFLKDKQYSPVVRTGKQALLQLEQIQTQINDQIFELVEKNKKQIQGFIRTLGTWTQFAPSLNEPHARAKKDLKKVNLLIVQDSPTKALQLSEKVLSNLNKTQTKIQKEIIPKKGKDFKMPNSLIDFVWIKELNAWVAKYETTNQQYRRFQPAHTSRAHENFTLDNEMQPVCWLSLHDVKTYIEWLNELCDSVPYLPEGYEFRLPNTREWKTFASCGQEYTYIWGNAWPPSYGNFANPAMFPENWQLDGYEAEFSVTCPVEQSGKNDWGIFGCAGNLWEWTSETKGRNQAVFGGAWTSTIKQLLKYDLKGKNFASPDDKYDNIGFRVVLAQPINK